MSDLYLMGPPLLFIFRKIVDNFLKKRKSVDFFVTKSSMKCVYSSHDFAHFRLPAELMDMPLAVIETIFSSTDLQIPYEDDVYDFLLKWACKHYQESEERNMIWNSRLLPLVRFCHMSWTGLHNILARVDDEIDLEQTTKRITDVLLHKAYPAHTQGSLAADPATSWQVPKRAYVF